MKSLRSVVTLMLAACLTGCGQPASQPTAPAVFALAAAADTGMVTVSAPEKLWPAAPGDWSKTLTLRVIGADGKPAATPLLGAYSFDAGKLIFRPQFPLSPGQEFEAQFDPRGWHADGAQKFPLTKRFRVNAAASGSPTRVEAIYPSATVLPANHFKFYILFSEPMWQRGFFKYLKLIDEKGNAVPEPFRETELWSEDGRRLTLWFHPGRQKTGVNLNVEIGPILRPGGQYTLEISGDWPVQSGGTLGETYRKKFSAVEADHAQPELAAWKISAPAAGTAAPLRVHFPEPLDWALLHSRVRVLHGDAVLKGAIEILESETLWQFTPSQPWAAGAHRLAVGAVLEDLAGNSLERPFEINLSAKPAASDANERFIDFTIK